MKGFLSAVLILWINLAFGQLQENFADGSFTSDPVWTGSNSSGDFIVLSGELRSNSVTGGSNFYLSTANSLANNCIWEFTCKLQFNPSGSNYTDIYLISDQADLQASTINGYFVRIGNTDDEISLYKRSGARTTSLKIIDGLNGLLNTSSNNIRVRVTRTAENLFTLERDLSGTGVSFFTEGSTTDSQHTASLNFGIYIQQSTASFFQKHFFDDIKIVPIITDTKGPDLLSARPVDSVTVEAVFNEPVDSVLARNHLNYQMSGLANPDMVTMVTPAVYRLHYSAALPTANYTLVASNIKDRSGNNIAKNSVQFEYVKPYVPKAKDIAFNEIFADPAPQVDLPAIEFIELLNTTDKVIHLNNWKYSDPSTTYTFGNDSLKAGEYLILCARTDTLEFKRFGRVLGISPWPSLNNAGDHIKLVSDKNVVIDDITYADTWYKDNNKKLGGYTIERIDALSACEGLYNWQASNDIAGGTPGSINSVNRSQFDLVSLHPDSISQTSDTSVIAYFNKPLNPATVSSENFLLSPAITFERIVTEAEGKTVNLIFSEPLAKSTNYVLTIKGINDCSGNEISTVNQPLTFTTASPPPVRADSATLFITEIFADPSPEVGLPLAEFVEIYNPGKDTIDLSGWSLSDASTRSIFSAASILPREQLILCPAADTVNYKRFGKVLGLAPWPSFTNTADKVVLKSFKGRTVDSIMYDDTWYKNTAKKSGGWTLERIDPLSKCSGSAAWAASTDTSGGTPGNINSVYRQDFDRLAFHPDSLQQMSDSTLTIWLNKVVSDASVTAEKFILSPASGIVKSSVLSTGLNQITVKFSQPFSPATKYALTLQGLNDCAGNEITTDNQPLAFTTASPPPVRADSATLFITEIFADSSPEVGLPLAEFVEIYNPGKDTIDLSGWSLSDATTRSIFSGARILPREQLIVCPAADTVHYKKFGKVLGLSPWPSFTNTADKVVLKSFKGRTVDSIAYDDTWYKNTAKKSGGWTLERIDPLSKCSGSAAWAACTDTSGGTPGKINSVNRQDFDNLAFHADSLQQMTDSTLTIWFNKVVSDVSLTPEKFILSPAAGLVKSSRLSATLNQITLTFSQPFSPATKYALTIQGLNDCSGNEITADNQPLTFTTASPPPVRPDTASLFITEIFADPSPEVGLPLAEFVEIYNPGKDKIDLSGWSLSDGTTRSIFSAASILPREQLILCPAADTVHYKRFGNVLGLAPWPSFTNNLDKVVLKSFKGRTVDSIMYDDTWYKNTAKKSGGWTLERIDPLSKCSGSAAWAASTDTSGGTPGKINSVYRQDFDQLAFHADSLQQMTGSTLTIWFNKVVSDVSLTPEKFILSPAAGLVKNSVLSATLKQITLTFSQPFSPATKYALTIQGLNDCSGNEITADNQPLTFTTASPPPVRPDTATLFITEIFADPSPEVGLPLVEFVEIYNPGKDTIDLSGWSLSDGTTRSILPEVSILPGMQLILCPAADTVQYRSFGNVAGLSPWPSFGNISDKVVLRSFKNRLVDSVAYNDTWYKSSSKKSGGWTLERIDLSSGSGWYNWSASANMSGGTPGRKNSNDNPGLTNLGLKIDSVSVLSDTVLSVFFNVIPDTTFLKAANFTVNGKAATLLTAKDNFLSCDVKFGVKFVEGVDYVLKVSQLRTSSGLVMAPGTDQRAFSLPLSPSLSYPLVINEIFADSSPVAGLPDAEFVELLNLSDAPVPLKGLRFSDESTSYVFSSGVIGAKGYLILCAVKDTLQFRPFGQVYGLNPWPTLNNDTETLKLSNNKDIEFHRVNYQVGWHHPKEKKSGGWSLELIDPRAVCSGRQNWASSEDPAGGTPGKSNSVSGSGSLPALSLSSFSLLDSITTILTFNRPVDSLAASVSKYYELNNGVGGPLTAIPLAPEFNQVMLKFPQQISRGATYRITVDSIVDCSGNLISSSGRSAEAFFPKLIVQGDIIINEILFNPRHGGADFVEIYNSSDHKLDLKQLYIATKKDTLTASKKITETSHYFNPGEYVVLTIDPDHIKREYVIKDPDAFLKVASMPSFNDDSGAALLLSGGLPVDELVYSEKMHYKLIKNAEGVSLERSSFKRPTNEPGNFRSAAASAGYATPGYKNSQFFEEDEWGDEQLFLTSKIVSPDNDGFEDVLQLNFNFADTGWVANISVYNDRGLLVKKLARNLTLAVQGKLYWDGLTERAERSPVGIYVIVVELFDQKGRVKKYKRSFVVAEKLN